jgi:tRNA (guanine37-N1)-methyltransferase
MRKNSERGYDIVGNIAIVKFARGISAREKKRIALKLMKKHKEVRTVLEKSDRIKGRLRVGKTKFILGERTKEVLYRENGCVFRSNVDNCYFSPRLANDRKEVAGMVKKGENVLVMFGGVAPYAIVIARNSKARKVVSVELGKECCKYALENVKRNKLEKRAEIAQGDVRRVVPKLREKFDRIVMARPNLKDSFLDVAFKAIRRGGVIHYHGFYLESEKDKMKRMILEEARRAGKKIKILRVERAGEIGVRKFRYRVDLKILN